MHLPKHGVGIVYVPGLEPLLEPGRDLVDVIEVEPQTLWNQREGVAPRYELPDRALEYLRGLAQPKIVHSVGFAVGGSLPPSPAVAAALADSITALGAAWASEHLSFTWFESADELVHTGFMLPALQNEGGVESAAASIRELKARLSVPLAVETTVNYMRPRKGELTDGEFVAATVEAADCGILLDLHNIWTNELNGRQGVEAFLSSIPLDRVWELHVAGGFEFEGYWLDSHSGSVPSPVLDWLRRIIPELPNLKAVIYEIYPSFVPLFGLASVEAELTQLRSIWDSARSSRAGTSDAERDGGAIVLVDGGEDSEPAPVEPRKEDREKEDPQFGTHGDIAAVTPQAWERALGELIVHGRSDEPIAAQLADDGAIELMRGMIWKFRASAITKVMGAFTRLVLLQKGADRLEQLLDEYLRATTPQPFASAEARGFIRFLRRQDLAIEFAGDVLAYEEASITASILQERQFVSFDRDPVALLEALSEDRIPEELTSGSYMLEVDGS